MKRNRKISLIMGKIRGRVRKFGAETVIFPDNKIAWGIPHTEKEYHAVLLREEPLTYKELYELSDLPTSYTAYVLTIEGNVAIRTTYTYTIMSEDDALGEIFTLIAKHHSGLKEIEDESICNEFFITFKLELMLKEVSFTINELTIPFLPTFRIFHIFKDQEEREAITIFPFKSYDDEYYTLLAETIEQREIYIIQGQPIEIVTVEELQLADNIDDVCSILLNLLKEQGVEINEQKISRHEDKTQLLSTNAMSEGFSQKTQNGDSQTREPLYVYTKREKDE